jgi:hypothetical protein
MTEQGRVWIVMTHGHRVDSIWTTEASAQRRTYALKALCGDSPDWQVELWSVATNDVLNNARLSRPEATP